MGIIEGDLRHASLTRVLQRVAAFGQNGILTLQGEDDIVAVSFLRGAVVSADALNQTIEDGLGKVLLSQGLIRAEDLAVVVREYQGGSSGSFADLLVQRGLVGRNELLEGLRMQTLRQMLQLLTWRQGEFKFYPGDEVSFEQGFVPISVEELLVRAIERLGDKVGLPGGVPDVDGVYRRVPPRGTVQVLDRDGDGTTLGIWLTEAQAAFLARIDGHRSAAEVGREVAFDRFKSQFTLYNLLFFDLVEGVGRAKSAPLADTRGGQAPAPGGYDPRAPMRPEAPRPAAGGMAPGFGAAPSPGTSPGLGAPPPGQLLPSIDLRPDTRPGVPAAGAPAPGVSAAGGTGMVAAPRAESGDLKAEIFLPPDRGAGEAAPGSGLYGMPGAARAGAKAAAPAKAGSDLLRKIGPGLAAVLLLGLALGLLLRPAAILLPFPWLETPRVAFERDLRQSLYLDVDRQAKTYFLITAHYPDSLAEMVGWGLLGSGDLRDPAGYGLEYSGADVSYTIQVKDGDQEVEGLGTTEAITGDFLVDPQFFRTGAAAESPLVFLE